jgi:hypothetical protein
MVALTYLEGPTAALGLLLGLLITGKPLPLGPRRDTAARRQRAARSPCPARHIFFTASLHCHQGPGFFATPPLSSPPLPAVTACLGVSGCVFRDLNQLSGHIVGGLLCTCLVFGYISQVMYACGSCL